MSDDPLIRWRLVLGESCQLALGCPGMGAAEGACDGALAWLYDREREVAAREIRKQRSAGGEAPDLSVPEWINQVHELFPKEAIERLESDAVERYGIEEVVTNPDVLRRVQPSQSLLKAVMRTRHLMNPGVLELARDLVRRVVEELMRKLATEVERAFRGSRRLNRSLPRPVSRDLDPLRTVRANLKHYDPERRKLVIETPWFYPRSRHQRNPWQLILVVDQSGSMLGSVIHAAVTAACLWGMPSLRTHLVVFSTEVVDLTEQVSDPVETLMQVQLGGGTDIARAMRYAADLVEHPHRSIVAVITDFYEGGNAASLVATVAELCAQGTHVLGLAALDPEAEPNYDRDLAMRLVERGAHVGAMTPGELADWVAEKVLR